MWLRARWYGAGRGGFGSRDPFAGDVQTPYSLMYYQYGYSNPVGNRDPSGRVTSSGTDGGECGKWSVFAWSPSDNRTSEGKGKWNIDERSLSVCLRPLLIKYATFHAQPADGFDSTTLAIIMGAIIQMENGDASFGDLLNRKLSNLINHTVIKQTSTSIVKISPGSVIEIYSCDIPLSNGRHYSTDLQPHYFTHEMMQQRLQSPGRLKQGDRYGYDVRGRFVPGDRGWVSDLLEDNEFAVEMLAINLKRGIIRAKAEGLIPSVFNLATWHNKGVQHAYAIRQQGNAGYGATVANFLLDRTAQDLHLSLRPDVRRWNTLPGDPNDEFPFVEACLPQNCAPQ